MPDESLRERVVAGDRGRGGDIESHARRLLVLNFARQRVESFDDGVRQSDVCDRYDLLAGARRFALLIGVAKFRAATRELNRTEHRRELRLSTVRSDRVDDRGIAAPK